MMMNLGTKSKPVIRVRGEGGVGRRNRIEISKLHVSVHSCWVARGRSEWPGGCAGKIRRGAKMRTRIERKGEWIRKGGLGASSKLEGRRERVRMVLIL